MGETQEVKALRVRIAELEAQHLELQRAGDAAHEANGPRAKGRLRGAAAVMLILIGALLAPIAVLGSWARAELVDTDRFVQTFAPLAQKPEVQQFVAAEVSAGITQNVDIDGMVGELFTGLAEMDLPPRAAAVLPLLEGTAASGVRSLIDTGVEQMVESPQFAGAWEIALRESHSRAISLIQGNPDSALQLADDGTLSLDLRTITAQVRERLIAQGLGFAETIPVVDQAVPILASDSLALVRTLYQLAVGLGFWLPWVALAAVVGGVLVARNRMRTLAWAGSSVAASLLLLSGGVGVGRVFFIGAVSPSIMPAATAEVLFVQLTELIAATLIALIALFLVVAVGAWLASSSRLAVSVRGAFRGGFATIRAAADHRGLHTGAFGRAIDRWHSAILVAAVLLGVLALFSMRPITPSGVATVTLGVFAVLLLSELLRRPASDSTPETQVDQPADGAVR